MSRAAKMLWFGKQNLLSQDRSPPASSGHLAYQYTVIILSGTRQQRSRLMQWLGLIDDRPCGMSAKMKRSGLRQSSNP
jgi:hypothetical protein